ncbi:MAG: hypothetical protein K1X78_21455 [Verrucomicrobiaceae bacterium]|nr:hypothetical protein [Verrucomicrobiaceae bacterium]
MKKIFLLIQLAALTSAMPAFALVGGPFDNGTFSVLDERTGYYESAYSFSNGSGYSVWTADNIQGALLSAGGGASQNLSQGSLLTSSGNTTHSANRTVLYYKGVTYFGAAFGQVDMESRTIQGFGNATSDYSTAQTTQTQNATFFQATSSSAFSTNTVVSSGRGYTANINWTGKVTSTSPQLRFTGSGEIAIISPNGNEAIASLAYTGYQGLITAINASVSRSGGQIFFDPTTYTQGASAVAQILNGTLGTPASSTVTPTYAQAVNAAGVPVDVNGNGIFNDDLIVSGQTVVNVAEIPGTPSLSSYLQGTGPDSSYTGSVVEKIEVSGYRRYY